MRKKFFSFDEKFNIKWNYGKFQKLNLDIENKNDLAKELEYQAKILKRIADNVRNDNLDGILEIYEDDFQERCVHEVAEQLENYNFEADHLYMEYVEKINHLCENENLINTFPTAQSIALMFDMGADADDECVYNNVSEIKNDLMDILNKTFELDNAFEDIDLDWCEEMMNDSLNAIAYKVENENNKKISAKDLDQAVNNGNAQLSENKEQTKMTQ